MDASPCADDTTPPATTILPIPPSPASTPTTSPPTPPTSASPPSTHPPSLSPPSTTQEPVALSTHEVQMRQYRTRSKAKGERERAAEVAAAELATRHPISKTRRKPGKRRGIPKPSSKPKKVRIGPSRIKGAGLGLFLLEDAEKGEWIARYSGEPLTRIECDKRKQSQYRVQVHKNLFLDAADKKHYEGRYINDPRGSRCI